ncbi:M48 family metalloprotease [Chitinimonas sp. BJYL2]|uniref:M48 family metalloprotease n=1 Tax=Chitinimonas sp. BJYL2 TaxID=2976696 RepID=UPI0022B47CEE|nr:M48 family metalloprotease [Chitinimonas sp. BJYL2]
MTRHPLLLALLCASLVLPAASELPDLGDSALANLPAHEEKRIAEITLRELRRSGMVLDDAEVDDYLQRLGYRLVGASDDNRINFRFFPIDEKTINAWAVPGGVIGVNLGLIVLSQHESELAAVIAHEIAHVTQHHYARMVESQKGSSIMSLGALALAILAASRSNGGDAPIAAMAATEGYQIQRYLDFSRDLEREADRVGIQTLAKAGFDTRAMPAFFDRMQKFYRNVDNGAYAFLRTHPVTLERISDSEARAAQQPYRQLADSHDYLLVREKLRVRQLGRQAALDYYRGTTEQRKYASELAQQYGYAYALFGDAQFDAAAGRLALARKQLPASHPMLEGLTAQILIGQGRADDAASVLTKAMERFPSAWSLRYAEFDLLIQRGQFKDAEVRIDQALTERPSDPALHKRLAQAYQSQGKTGAYHRAMAEYYALIDEPAPAIEQLNLARRQGGDYYLLSAIEARIRDMRARLPVDKKGKPIIPVEEH